MKKIYFYAAVMGLLSIASCSKKGTCTCKDTNGTVLTSQAYEGSNYDAGKSACASANTTLGALGSCVFTDN
jgi:hypothetical protein